MAQSYLKYPAAFCGTHTIVISTYTSSRH